MNRQPYRTPPQWWSPRLSPHWISFWRPIRRRRALWHHGLSSVEVRGGEHLQQAINDGHGVLITPNHPTHADPFALLAASDQLGVPLHFLTAWQVFAMTHWLGRRVLRQHGCFSINREGHDLKAIRQGIRILEQSGQPLVMFPEGEVFHLNDRIMHFRRGAATMALRAARRSGRPVACIPCAIKFQYVSDPTANLLNVMSRLEQRLSWPPRPGMPLARRIRRVADGVLGLKELEYLGQTGSGSLRERIDTLLSAVLGRLEDRYLVTAPRATVPERVKQLRLRVIARREATTVRSEQVQFERDLEDLFFVMQLFSYPADYLAGQPSLERLAETLDKLEEDVLRVPTARKRGTRRAIVTFGEPVLVEASDSRAAAVRSVTGLLQTRVQGLLDGIVLDQPVPVERDTADAPLLHPELVAPWSPAVQPA